MACQRGRLSTVRPRPAWDPPLHLQGPRLPEPSVGHWRGVFGRGSPEVGLVVDFPPNPA